MLCNTKTLYQCLFKRRMGPLDNILQTKKTSILNKNLLNLFCNTAWPYNTVLTYLYVSSRNSHRNQLLNAMQNSKYRGIIEIEPLSNGLKVPAACDIVSIFHTRLVSNEIIQLYAIHCLKFKCRLVFRRLFSSLKWTGLKQYLYLL